MMRPNYKPTSPSDDVSGSHDRHYAGRLCSVYSGSLVPERLGWSGATIPDRLSGRLQTKFTPNNIMMEHNNKQHPKPAEFVCGSAGRGDDTDQEKAGETPTRCDDGITLNPVNAGRVFSEKGTGLLTSGSTIMKLLGDMVDPGENQVQSGEMTMFHTANMNVVIHSSSVDYDASTGPVQCPECCEKFSGKSRYTLASEHMQTKHNRSLMFRCSCCHDFENAKACGINAHYQACIKRRNLMSVEQPLDAINVPSGGKGTSKGNVINSSLRVMRKSYPFNTNPPCDICQLEFKGRYVYSSLAKHMSESHGVTVLLVCDKCELFEDPRHEKLSRHHKKCSGAPVNVVDPSPECGSSKGVSSSIALEQIQGPTDKSLTVDVEPSARPSCPRTDVAPDTINNGLIPNESPASVQAVLSEETEPKACTINEELRLEESTCQIQMDHEDGHAAVDCSMDNSSHNFVYSTTEAVDLLDHEEKRSDLHPRYRSMIQRVRMEVLGWNDLPSQDNVNSLCGMYTRYLTAAGRDRGTRNPDRLKQLQLGVVPLQKGSDLIFRTLAQLVFQNPARSEVIRKGVINTLRDNRHRWEERLLMSEGCGVNFRQFMTALKSKSCLCHSIVIQAASNLYGVLIKVVYDNPHLDEIYCPERNNNGSHGTRYIYADKNGNLMPCFLRRGGTKKSQRTIEIKRNRALYFADTARLAREVLGKESHIQCPVPAREIETHFNDVFGNVSAAHESMARPNTPDSILAQELFKPTSQFYQTISSSELARSVGKMGDKSSPGLDGVSVNQIRRFDPNLVILTILVNSALVSGYMPNTWRDHRSVLLPKAHKIYNDGELLPGAAQRLDNWRPITISSILARIFHKVLLARLSSAYKFKSNQKAFSDAAVGANVFAIRKFLQYCNGRKQRRYMAFLDIKSAFDTLEHSQIEAALRRARCPEFMIRYIVNSYSGCTTQFKVPNGTTNKVKLERGVKQGDPLSSFLFAFVIDNILSKLDPLTHGFHHENISLSHIAYADDIVMIANNPNKLQLGVTLLAEGIAKLGLTFSVGKCQSHGKYFRNGSGVVESRPFLHIGNDNIPLISQESPVRYLGCDPLSSATIDRFQERVDKAWKLLKSAKLSPTQMVHLFNDYYVPKLTFGLINSDISATAIERLSTSVRATMKRVLRLPHFLNHGFFHLPAKNGGMGIRCIFDECMQARIANMQQFETQYPDLASWSDGSKLINQMKRAINPNYDAGKDIKSNRINRLLAEWKGAETQSQGMDLFVKYPPPYELMMLRYRRGTHLQYLQQVRLRLGLLQTASTLNRMTTHHGRDVSCRHCSAVKETPLHVISECQYIKPAMIKRHDAVQKRFIYALRMRNEGRCVIEDNPRFTLDDGKVLKPDLVVSIPSLRKAFVIDFAVIYETDNAKFQTVHKRKVDKYECLRPHVAKRYAVPVENVKCLAAVVGSRGVVTDDLIHVIRMFDLSVNTAANMAQTAAEQSIAVYNYFNQRQYGYGRRQAR